MNVNIKIFGTKQDSQLLKKIIKQYAENTTSKKEKCDCQCYISLIEQAEREAAQKQKEAIDGIGN